MCLKIKSYVAQYSKFIMQKYNCIIVEDEPLAAEVLQDYVQQVPFLALKATCANAIFAMEALRKEAIDVIFLDINLPKLKGLDFLKTLKNPPAIIITTAYHDYALQGYEHNVLDYLLKPIEFSRFLMAVNKLQTVSEPPKTLEMGQSEERKYAFFNEHKKMVRVFFEDILYVEGQKEYVKIVAKNQVVTTKMTLNDIETRLNSDNFIRIHRSFIVAKDKIEAFSATEIDINKQQIPIGRGYKESVLAIIAR